MITHNDHPPTIVFGVVNTFWYTNHRGEREKREFVPLHLRFGTCPYYPTPQWLMECYDPIKNAPRTLALANVEILS